MATDLSALLVYWMGSGGKQDEVIAEILQEVSYKMRYYNSPCPMKFYLI